MLVRDVNNVLRVFAAHTVQPTTLDGDHIAPVDIREVRWYVIDPDLANFPGASWAPSIEVAEAIPSDPGDETYHGVIGVNPEGAAYLAFTRSNGDDLWPSLYKGKLSASYTSILFENSSITGPSFRYVGGNWADFADLQADPTGCGFWTHEVLVSPDWVATQGDSRRSWVTRIAVNCNSNAEMNGDGSVDELDMALYLDYYAKEDQPADMDRSGTVDSTDFSIYTAEYAKR